MGKEAKEKNATEYFEDSKFEGSSVTELIGAFKLTKNIKSDFIDISNISREEMKMLVDLYYQLQDNRKRSREQIRSIEQGRDGGKPCNASIMNWVLLNQSIIEKQIPGIMKQVCENDEVGRWLLQIKGIGPVLACGLLAYFNVEGRKYSNTFISYAGLNDHNRPWLGKEKSKAIIDEVLGTRKKITEDDIAKIAAKTQWSVDYLQRACYDEKKDKVVYSRTKLQKACAKIPYNKSLKTLMWKVAQAFIYQSSNGSYYGKLYLERKAYEIKRNDEGYNKAYAEANIGRLTDKSTETYKAYSEGKIPDSQITARARRWVEQLFLSHLFDEMYRVHNDALPPIPYILAHPEKDSTIQDITSESPEYISERHNRYIEPEVPYTLVSSEKEALKNK